MLSTADTASAYEGPADLVRQIGAGDRAAENELVKRYQRPLLEMLRHRAGDIELAQDLLQDTFSIIILRLRGAGIEDPDRLVAFMHRTAHNLVIGHFRKEHRRNTQANTEIVEIEADPAEGQLSALLSREKSVFVRKLLEDLHTPRDKEVLQRFYVWEQEKALICEALDLTADQFDRVISRARQRFRALVEAALGDES